MNYGTNSVEVEQAENNKTIGLEQPQRLRERCSIFGALITITLSFGFAVWTVLILLDLWNKPTLDAILYLKFSNSTLIIINHGESHTHEFLRFKLQFNTIVDSGSKRDVNLVIIGKHDSGVSFTIYNGLIIVPNQNKVQEFDIQLAFLSIKHSNCGSKLHVTSTISCEGYYSANDKYIYHLPSNTNDFTKN